jgi:hypothetical protein
LKKWHRDFDREIEAAAAAMIRSHLDGCESCRAELNRMQAVDSFLSEADPIAVPTSFHSNVMTQARRLNRSNSNSIAEILGDLAGWWRRAGGGLRLATATTAVCGLVAGMVLGNSFTPNFSSTSTGQLTDSGDVYSLDFLGDSPQGSLTEVYLTIVEEREGEEK